MRLLVFTTLFPRPAAPHHGIFVRERLKAFLNRFDAEATVIAPVPYVPRALAAGNYREFRDVPREEVQEGIRVLHPRYPLIPKLNMHWAPLSLALAGSRGLRRLLREGQSFDLVDAHYLYPDAVSAMRLARDLNCPLVVTARGTDVNLIPRFRIPRWWLRRLLKRASAAITVCQALKDAMAPLHGPSLPVHVLGNGVDLEKFRPVAADVARRHFGWSGDEKIVLSVGHLIERKGHHHLLRALPAMESTPRLKIVGVGPMRAELQQLARTLNVSNRVEFVGAVPHEKLHLAYSAADVLMLLSSREGWPNVLLESLACGTPVVATKVWGSPEVIPEATLGHLLGGTEPAEIASAVEELFAHPRPPGILRAHAEQHSWTRAADGMMAVFSKVLGRAPLSPRTGPPGSSSTLTTGTA